MLSFVIPTYNRPKYLRDCLESLASQTSREFEVIVVCNGSPQSTYDVINDFEARLPALKTVRLPTNIWSWDDWVIFFRAVHKPGLEACTGEFVLFLSDDDALSDRFVERVVRMFELNPECVAVTGLAISRNLVTGQDSPVVLSQEAEHRPVMEDGKELALKFFSSKKADRNYFLDPGFGYVVRSSFYRDEGLPDCFWREYQMEQYLFLLPQGLVGYDKEAIMYWGRHSDQANLLLNSRIGMLRYYQVEQRSVRDQAVPFWYSRFGADWAQRLAKRNKENRAPRTLRFILKPHPDRKLVEWDVIKIVRHPRVFRSVALTDARESLFWILLPRALVSLFAQGCQRGAAAMRTRIRQGPPGLDSIK